jgi:hypothetical protein
MDQQKRGFIFFDMDETLGFFRNYDGSMNDQGFPDGIYLRPGIKNLLKTLKENFILSVSTAATVNYAHKVLEHAGLKQYFDKIFTRDEFVKLENQAENDNEASPSGFTKQYSKIMKFFNIDPKFANFGMVVGDNDYDMSSDIPELSTLIVDSLFIPTDVILAVIIDYFNKNEMDYSELGIEVKKFLKKHPLSGMVSKCIEIDVPESLTHAELEKIDIKLIKDFTVHNRNLSRSQKEIITPPPYSRNRTTNLQPIRLQANRFGLLKS